MKIIVMCAMLISMATAADIIKVSSIQEAAAKFQEILKKYKPNEVLVAIDMDMTLTTPSHPAAMMANLIKHKAIYKEVIGPLTPHQRYRVLNLAVIHGGALYLVEPMTKEVIQKLQTQVSLIVLTAAISDGVSWRYETLKGLGLDFAHRGFLHDAIDFKELTAFQGKYPAFYRGLLAANGGNEKGTVLIAFLKKQELKPKTIVMWDDRRENLIEVAEALKSFDPTLKFIGIEYTGAAEQPTPEISAEDFRAFWIELVAEVLKDTP